MFYLHSTRHHLPTRHEGFSSQAMVGEYDGRIPPRRPNVRTPILTLPHPTLKVMPCTRSNMTSSKKISGWLRGHLFVFLKRHTTQRMVAKMTASSACPTFWGARRISILAAGLPMRLLHQRPGQRPDRKCQHRWYHKWQPALRCHIQPAHRCRIQPAHPASPKSSQRPTESTTRQQLI